MAVQQDIKELNPECDAGVCREQYSSGRGEKRERRSNYSIVDVEDDVSSESGGDIVGTVSRDSYRIQLDTR